METQNPHPLSLSLVSFIYSLFLFIFFIYCIFVKLFLPGSSTALAKAACATETQPFILILGFIHIFIYFYLFTVFFSNCILSNSRPPAAKRLAYEMETRNSIRLFLFQVLFTFLFLFLYFIYNGLRGANCRSQTIEGVLCVFFEEELIPGRPVSARSVSLDRGARLRFSYFNTVRDHYARGILFSGLLRGNDEIGFSRYSVVPRRRADPDSEGVEPAKRASLDGPSADIVCRITFRSARTLSEFR